MKTVQEEISELSEQLAEGHKRLQKLINKLDLDSPTLDEIFKKARTIVCEIIGIEKRELKIDSVFTNFDLFDSLDMIEMIAAIEEEFNIGIPDEEAENLKTFGDLIRYLKAKV